LMIRADYVGSDEHSLERAIANIHGGKTMPVRMVEFRLYDADGELVEHISVSASYALKGEPFVGDTVPIPDTAVVYEMAFTDVDVLDLSEAAARAE